MKTYTKGKKPSLEERAEMLELKTVAHWTLTRANDDWEFLNKIRPKKFWKASELNYLEILKKRYGAGVR